MVLGILGVIAGATASPLAAVSTATSVVGISQAGQGGGGGGGGGGGAEPNQNDPRLAKFNLVVACDHKSSSLRHLLNNKIVVLRNKKLYLDSSDPTKRTFKDGHPFSGFYLDYPSPTKPSPRGLVSTISSNPPELNWVYIDRNTLQLTYGNKSESINHIYGPWDWTQDDGSVGVGLTVDGWEGFVAVEEKIKTKRKKGSGSGSSSDGSHKSDSVWYLAYDKNEDRLKSVGVKGRVVDVYLERVLQA